MFNLERTSRVANKIISRSREYHPRTLCRHGRQSSVVLVSGIEAGRVNVGFDLLCRIAEGLDVSPGALGDRDPDKWQERAKSK